jgi:hypothetical protein
LKRLNQERPPLNSEEKLGRRGEHQVLKLSMEQLNVIERKQMYGGGMIYE